MNDLVSKFKALGDPVRLSIIHFLKTPNKTCCINDDGVCACDVESFLGLTQPTVSHHMKVLVQAGLVTAKKRSRFIYYELNQNGFQAIMLEFAQCCTPNNNPMTLVDEGISDEGGEP